MYFLYDILYLNRILRVSRFGSLSVWLYIQLNVALPIFAIW